MRFGAGDSRAHISLLRCGMRGPRPCSPNTSRPFGKPHWFIRSNQLTCGKSRVERTSLWELLPASNPWAADPSRSSRRVGGLQNPRSVLPATRAHATVSAITMAIECRSYLFLLLGLGSRCPRPSTFDLLWVTQPRMLPSHGDVLIIAPKLNMEAIVVAEFKGLVLAGRYLFRHSACLPS